MDAKSTRVQVSLPGAQRFARTPFGAEIVIHALAAETSGTLGMWDTFTPPGQGPAPHTHTRETEAFRIMRSTYRFWCGDDMFDAPAGSVVVLPRGVEHSWRNVGDEAGQMLAIVTPGGLEQMFLDIAALDAYATPAQIAVIEDRYGIINDETRALRAVSNARRQTQNL